MADISKKRKLGLKMARSSNGSLFKIMIKINLIVFHWNERRRYLSKSKKSTKKYYVIRSRSASEGLLSTYFFALSHIKWGLDNGFIPVVKFDDGTCQYFVNREINGTTNAWEYFFTQPTEYDLKKIEADATVLQSGWTLSKKGDIPEYNLNPESIAEIRKFALKHCPVQPYIWEKAEKICEETFERGQTLGVFIRGTDYVALKPKGHYIQPTVEQLKEKIDEFVAKYDPKKIFVVTEDFTIYNDLKQTYGDRVFSSDSDFVKNYDTADYLSTSMNDDPYTRGLNYLIRILLLSKCDYLVSSITNGSLFTQVVKNDQYSDEYWFDLGLYE